MRRAFVIGSNGPKSLEPLRYAQKDADDMASALRNPRCGFTVTTPKVGLDSFEMRRQLIAAVEACTTQDTFICYLSGHGFIAQGELYLLLDNSSTDQLLSTALHVADILHALNMCKARSKLLILDCCFAGVVVRMSGLKDAQGIPSQAVVRPDNYLVLMASDHLERARELELLQGSFLTVNVCRALTDCFYEADADGDNRLSIQDLRKWLQDEATKHNQEHPREVVPVPFIFGKERGEQLFLTVGETDYVRHEIPWCDGSTIVVLPIYPIPDDNYLSWKYLDALFRGDHFQAEELSVREANRRFRRPEDLRGLALGIGKHPIRTEQFIRAAQDKECGFISYFGEPWTESDEPMMDVSYLNALRYTLWINNFCFSKEHGHRTFIPFCSLWDFAAFGTIYPVRKPSTWLGTAPIIHHNQDELAKPDFTGARTNRFGIADMIGNVWEWCFNESNLPFTKVDPSDYYDAASESKSPWLPELRGGGYADDLSKRDVFIPNNRIVKDTTASFRIAGTIPLSELPMEVTAALSVCGPLESRFEASA